MLSCHFMLSKRAMLKSQSVQRSLLQALEMNGTGHKNAKIQINVISQVRLFFLYYRWLTTDDDPSSVLLPAIKTG